MNPEDTDKFRRFEDLIQSLVQVPEKKVDEKEQAESKTSVPDKPSNGASDDPRG